MFRRGKLDRAEMLSHDETTWGVLGASWGRLESRCRRVTVFGCLCCQVCILLYIMMRSASFVVLHFVDVYRLVLRGSGIGFLPLTCVLGVVIDDVS